ncbi:MAG TPA: hypothetical protein VIV60_04430 [Polyangiaceae bacterium]
MLIRWSYRRTVCKMSYGRSLSGDKNLMLDTIVTWRVLWILFVPIFACAIHWEIDR